MAKHHEEHPDYGAMGIFAGYGECDREPSRRKSPTAQIAALQARVEELTKALESARGEIVVAIAFIGRDLYSDRINDTADSLHTRLSKADADARLALSMPLEDRK